MTSEQNEIDGYKWAVEHGYLESGAKFACQQLVEELFSKFRIILKTDSPEKWIEWIDISKIEPTAHYEGRALKWRGDK